MSSAPDLAAQARAAPPGFAEGFDQVPVMLALVADLTKLASVDRDADHYTMVGGASIYPLAWSILLAARGEGLAGVMTTMVVRAGRGVAQPSACPSTASWPPCSPSAIRCTDPPGCAATRSSPLPPSTGSTAHRWRPIAGQ